MKPVKARSALLMIAGILALTADVSDVSAKQLTPVQIQKEGARGMGKRFGKWAFKPLVKARRIGCKVNKALHIQRHC